VSIAHHGMRNAYDRRPLVYSPVWHNPRCSLPPANCQGTGTQTSFPGEKHEVVELLTSRGDSAVPLRIRAVSHVSSDGMRPPSAPWITPGPGRSKNKT